MRTGFESIDHLEQGSETIRRRRYGMIDVIDGQLREIRFRPWPKLISLAEVRWWGERSHRQRPADRCRAFFNQPLRHANYLALKYIVSDRGTSLKSLRQCLSILDYVAWVKRSDAILCEVTNDRISDRLFRRWGWERHLPQSSRRHYIKRFYGDYSSIAGLPRAADESRWTGLGNGSLSKANAQTLEPLA